MILFNETVEAQNIFPLKSGERGIFTHRGLFRFLRFHQIAFNPFYREDLSMFSLISPNHQQTVFDSYVPKAIDEHYMMSHCQGNAKIGV